MTDPTKDHRRVTPEGREIGRNLARMTEPAIAALAAEGEPDERCKTCAFRAGTVPNGCLQTMGDALKCVIEGVPFGCHQADKAGEICHGWFAATASIKLAEKTKGPLPVIKCPWDFTLPDEPQQKGGDHA